MKKIKIGLLARIVIAIILGIAIGTFFPAPLLLRLHPTTDERHDGLGTGFHLGLGTGVTEQRRIEKRGT